MGLAAAGRKCLSEVGCMLASEIIGTGLGTVVGGMIGRATSTGHPVHAATGAKVLSGPEDRDFTLEGHIPLVWQRIYNSRNPQSGRLGRGWTLPFDVSLRIEDSLTHPGEDECIYTDMSGRDLKLGSLAPGQDVYYTDEGFRVYRSLQNIFLLETKDGEYQLFEADPLTRNRLRLSQTLDRHDNALFYRYNLDGLLTHIHDELNEVFAQLHYSPAGQLCFVTQHNNEEHERRLVEYIYNDHGQLTAVRDADGRITRRFASMPITA